MSSSGTKGTPNDSSTYVFSTSESLESDSEVVSSSNRLLNCLHLPEHLWYQRAMEIWPYERGFIIKKNGRFAEKKQSGREEMAIRLGSTETVTAGQLEILLNNLSVRSSKHLE